MLAPSSNSVLEPVTYAMLAGIAGISAHFSRFRVTEIALMPALDQFDPGCCSCRFAHDARSMPWPERHLRPLF
jgi:hypothetical protein